MRVSDVAQCLGVSPADIRAGYTLLFGLGIGQDCLTAAQVFILAIRDLMLKLGVPNAAVDAYLSVTKTQLSEVAIEYENHRRNPTYVIPQQYRAAAIFILDGKIVGSTFNAQTMDITTGQISTDKYIHPPMYSITIMLPAVYAVIVGRLIQQEETCQQEQ